MRVVVTRPAQEAQGWVHALEDRGHDVLQLPLIEIAAAADGAPLRSAWDRLAAYRAAMFVSANAVRGFHAAGRAAWPARTAAWATGPGTVAALRAAGVPAARIVAPDAAAASHDSESLWSLVAADVARGDRVLIVRGAGADGEPAGRDWLADTLRAAGVDVDTVAAYVRRLPAWSGPQREQARRAAAEGATWLFSSSEAIANLRALLPGQDWSAARAIATHERIAQAARQAGFAVVCLSRADQDAVVRTLESSG